ncbi:radical SAM protein [Atopobiaceae bacterium 24-176]
MADATGFRALYLHVPFCVRKCAYCDFASSATDRHDPLMAAYARSLAAMVRCMAGEGLLDGLSTAYVGGGTPSLLGAEGLSSLIGAVPPVEELTFEANPESFSADLAAAARDAGAARVSLGIQSLADDELACLGRVHDAARARAALAEGAAAGLRVSADLMAAVPRQTPESLVASVEGVVAAGASHVSVYPLMIEEGTAFARAVDSGAMEEPTDDDEAAAMEAAEGTLARLGLSRYEVASYALPGERCRHNLSYWNGTPYLGLGTAAASMADRGTYGRLRRLVPGLPAVASSTARVRLTCDSTAREVAAAEGDPSRLSFGVEELTAREAAAEDLMLAARTSDGLGPGMLARARDAVGAAAVDRAVDTLVGEGLLAPSAVGGFAPTERGWLMGNEVFGALWDLAGEG